MQLNGSAKVPPHLRSGFRVSKVGMLPRETGGVDYAGASGINNVEWDAVELPSQFMENWCYDRPTLMGMAKHYETGELLPEHYYQKLLAARHYMSGSGMLRQLHFSCVDLELHHRYLRKS